MADSSLKEIGNKVPCPCNSGKAYKRCCKKKNFKWLENENGEFVKQVPIAESADILKDYIEVREHIYGRKFEPDESFFLDYVPDEHGNNEINMMRRAQISENHVYAFYQTGRILTEMNRDKIPDIEIEEYLRYFKEYDLLMEKEDNAVFYSRVINEELEATFLELHEQLVISFNYFVRKHVVDVHDLLNYTIKNIIDFCGFCCIKSIKNLDAVKALLDLCLTENIYATDRFIYESYLHVLAFNQNPKLFNEKIIPKLNEEDYYFASKPDGTINYNKVIHKETNQKIDLSVKIKELALLSSYDEDLKLYNIFYQYSSQFVHVDVLSAKSILVQRIRCRNQMNH